jgi:hypothetical protein
MALFPRIQSPCPYKDRLGEIMTGDTCNQCDRQVHDITGLSDSQRLALVAGGGDEICVSYRVAARTVMAAAAMGAGFGMTGAVAAQPAADAASLPAAGGANEIVASYSDEVYPDDSMVIIVGGLKEPRRTVWVDPKRPAGLAKLPVVYEDAPTAKPAKAKSAR